MIKQIINVCNKAIPKKNVVLFNSFPDFAGNAYALYKYIVNERPDLLKQYKMFWMVENETDKSLPAYRKVISDGTQVVKKKSIKGFWYLLHAKKVISTHNYISGIQSSGKQKYYNIWHGMPFKAIGNHLTSDHEKDIMQTDYTIATSELFKTIMAKAFDIPEENVMVTGQPVNDMLFSRTEAISKLGIKSIYEKVILWLPTYRKSIIGAKHEDGDENSFGVKSVFCDYYSQITTLCKQKNILLLVKPHPMDAINSLTFSNNDYVKCIKNKELEVAGVDLYELLAETDCLVTDYSSVYIDYLCTGKPIAFVYDDLKGYESSRGFLFSPPEKYLPGFKISNYDELEYYLKNFDLCNKKYSHEREKIQSIMNPFSDANACERVCKFIFG